MSDDRSPDELLKHGLLKGRLLQEFSSACLSCPHNIDKPVKAAMIFNMDSISLQLLIYKKEGGEKDEKGTLQKNPCTRGSFLGQP